MRILKLSRDVNWICGSAEVHLSAYEIKMLYEILRHAIKKDGTCELVKCLAADFYALNEILQHGGFDEPAVKILCEMKNNRSKA